MNEHTLKVLEWGKLLEILSTYATSEPGKERCLNIEFINDLDELEILQDQTQEAIYLLETEGKIPLGGIRHISEFLSDTEKGIVLQPYKLIDISNTIRAGRILKNFFSTKVEKIPQLWKIVQPIMDLKFLEDEIDSCFDRSGNIMDTASPKLSKIRNKINSLKDRIRQKLSKLTRSPEFRHIFHSDLISQRNDRYVVSLKSGCQSQLEGIIHDQSSSGATLFYEPMFILNDNNELRKQYMDEQLEIEKILLELTNKIRAHLSYLYKLVDILSEIDCIVAKANYSLSIKAVRPKINNDGVILLKKVKHPLLINKLSWEKVVPIDIEIGTDFNTLIITGPNTGGKTVSLKTVGICALMVKIGLQIPADLGSSVGNFEKILVDIGDEQSIEQNLSTFSGHMSNIINILEETTLNSLVLIDEIGTGTDPEEGVALAKAILEELHKKGAKTLITTHYGELKSMAFHEKEMENAAVEFDIKTLKPTYRLLMGVPGSSNAMIISQRLGLPIYIIDRAKELLGEDKQNINSSIEKLERQRKKLEDETIILSSKVKELEKIKEEYFKEKEKLEESKRIFIEKSKKQLYEEFEDARAQIAEIIRELQQGEKTSQNAAIATKRLKEIENKYLKSSKFNNKKEQTINEQDIKIGKKVYIPHLEIKGEVLSKPDKSGNIEILCGNFKMNVKLEDIELISEKEFKDEVLPSAMKIRKIRKNIKNECDLRGMFVEDAIITTEKFLDETYDSGLEKLYIIHGKGTGVLRKAIQEYLKVSPYVKSFYLATPLEGGSGVTVVNLKKD